ncbi:MAG: SCO family protein [Betaproteobacteria bacterium]|nr:MAG: SCO family protein [Betaproteobacteria bacterium]
MFNGARWLGAIFLALTVAGCGVSSPQFRNTDVTGADCCRDFQLTDHHGKARTLADFRGKVVVIFFGYTQCPDVCPTTMVELKSAMQQLGADAQRVQVLFVTLDPERDTRELLANYVPAFDPGFLGLYGNLETTAKTAKEFRVFFQKQPGPTPTSYTVDHSAGSYVFDSQGKVRLFVRHGDGGANLVADLRSLLKQG